MVLNTSLEPGPASAVKTRSAELCDLAAEGLVPMIDPGKQIFCNIYGQSEQGIVRDGLSARYTMMSLLGLHRYQQSGRRSPISIQGTLDHLLKDFAWMDNVGDLGLLLWTCAELNPEKIPAIYSRFQCNEALSRFPDAVAGTTMHLAWFLTGLAGCILSGHGNLPGLEQVVKNAQRMLENNCGNSGLFGHLARSGSVRGFVRGRIGSFADQVYPTIAFARLAQALNDERPRETALRTARKICELQGPMGEWFWHYDSVSGTVISRYPIYSVHQHGMGPMMLFAASEAANVDFSAAIAKSLAWVDGNNELKLDMVDTSLSLIWRCIYLDGTAAMRDRVLRKARMRKAPAGAQQLKVRYECRPYELGWLLYAFAGRS